MVNYNYSPSKISYEDLPSDLEFGSNLRIYANNISVGKNVKFGNDVTLVGDSINIGNDSVIGNNCDIRASEILINNKCDIQNNNKILVAEKFVLGTASRLCSRIEITCRYFEAGQFFFLGHESTVGYGGTLESTAKVFIGNNVALGPHNILNANCSIKLNNSVGSGSYVTFWTHGFHFGHSILDGYSASFEDIEVDENVWLGYHVTLLPGISIGKNTIVASGSVVTKKLPKDSLVGGVPARVIKPLSNAKKTYKESVKVISDVIIKWLHELSYKGWDHKENNNSKYLLHFMLQNKLNKENYELFVVKNSSCTLPINKGIPQIIICIGSHTRWDNLLGNKTCLLGLKSGIFHGYSSELTQDLRNHLRRHTLVCGNDELLSSIVPLDFKRLLEV